VSVVRQEGPVAGHAKDDTRDLVREMSQGGRLRTGNAVRRPDGGWGDERGRVTVERPHRTYDLGAAARPRIAGG
jgi:hypothetical protein